MARCTDHRRNSHRACRRRAGTHLPLQCHALVGDPAQCPVHPQSRRHKRHIERQTDRRAPGTRTVEKVGAGGTAAHRALVGHLGRPCMADRPARARSSASRHPPRRSASAVRKGYRLRLGRRHNFLFEADDGLIHRQAFARIGQQLFHHAVALGLQHILHFHRLDLGQHLAGLDLLSHLDGDLGQQARHR